MVRVFKELYEDAKNIAKKDPAAKNVWYVIFLYQGFPGYRLLRCLEKGRAETKSVPRLCQKLSAYHSSSVYERISPGWHSRILHIASRVEKRTAFALPVLRIERFAMVMPTFSESSVMLIFRFASMTSRFTCIAMSTPSLYR